ncbi:MAG: hypothetical protein H8E66_24370 [Planctomycetes bacterium]|nr:hypothetical protein [Planctomycetota bacterium]
MSSVKILPNLRNSRITSEQARNFKPRGVFILNMEVIERSKASIDDKIAAVSLDNAALKELAKQHPAPDEWYAEED